MSTDVEGVKDAVVEDNPSQLVDSSFVLRHVDGETTTYGKNEAGEKEESSSVVRFLDGSDSATVSNVGAAICPDVTPTQVEIDTHLVSTCSTSDDKANYDTHPTGIDVKQASGASPVSSSAAESTASSLVSAGAGVDIQGISQGPYKHDSESSRLTDHPSNDDNFNQPMEVVPASDVLVAKDITQSLATEVAVEADATKSASENELGSDSSVVKVLHGDSSGPDLEVMKKMEGHSVNGQEQSAEHHTTGVKVEEKEESKAVIEQEQRVSDRKEEEAAINVSVGAVGGEKESAAKPIRQSTADSDEEKQSIYHVKWIKHKTTTMPVITQNENGPCPLLAIMNLLLLQSKIKLAPQTEIVTSNELMAHLADWIFEHVPKNISEDTRLNYEQNMHDAIAVFPRLQTGLDVNVRFTGVSEFEYTPECIVFDLLDVPLYHGWLVDPQMPDLVSAIGNRTYNQLVEKIILQKNSNKEELVAEALLAEEFLNITASQLTYHGLSELSATIREEEMCVFFRNNHFNTLYRRNNELFVLVTDQGFLRESNVVWETLSNIEGDGHFVDADFRTYRLPEASNQPLPTSSFPVNSKEQIDHDYLVALSLVQEQSEMQPAPLWSPSAATISDHELALRLQEEENMSAENAARQPAQRQTIPASPLVPASNSGGSSGGSGSGNSGSSKEKSSCSLM